MTTQGKRGFAGMDPEQQREIASRGGKAAHAQGRAHEFTTEEAQRAGKKGGNKVAENRAHMAAIGRLGGKAKKRNAQRATREETETEAI